MPVLFSRKKWELGPERTQDFSLVKDFKARAFYAESTEAAVRYAAHDG